MKRRDLNFALAGLGTFGALPYSWAQTSSTASVISTPQMSLATAKLVALRTWPAPDSLRLTLEYSGLLKVESFLLEDGVPRLVIDLIGLVWNTESQNTLNQIIASNTMVERLRAAVQPVTGAVRLVLELKRNAVAEVNTVPAAGQYQSRVLVDIYPAKTDLLGLWLSRQQSAALKPPVIVVEPKAVPALNSTTSPVQNKSDSQDKNTSKTTAISKTKKIIKTIAIDAGHGGEDPGAIGPAGTLEKDVVLAMALQLAQRLRSRMGWNVVLTRDGDYYVPLAQRVQLARAAKADLFVSLHADAFYTPTAKGASVYALSDKGASSAAAKWIANKENKADLIGGLNLSSKDKQLSSVLLDLSTTAQIKSSLSMGRRMVQQLGGVAHLHKKQVEQAGFAVLKAPDMPSLLIETAFISHPDEERLLADPAHQAKLVAALSRSIATLV